jgi:CRP-like cAMP-binding protein
MNEWLQRLRGGQVSEYAKDALIAHPQTSHNQLFVIESGRARICLLGGAREQTLTYLEAGSLFVTHTPTWIEALEPTRIRSWPLRDLRALIEAQPDIAIIALREVGQLMAATLELVEDLAFHSVESRLARYLLRSSALPDSSLQLQDSMEILASRLGTSRQTLSTLLNRMIRDGLIERTGRRAFRICRIETLQALADDLSAG